jgi:hypothetical protein
MRALELCPICELPRFVHGWRIFQRRTNGMPFREPFNGSPTWRDKLCRCEPLQLDVALNVLQCFALRIKRLMKLTVYV